MDDTRHLSELRLLNAALAVIRAKGYSATRIEAVCAEAGLTKGSFFHHFNGKEDLAVAAADYWSETTSAFFADAPYHQIADPLDRLLGYIDYRKELLGGRPAEFSCLVGTMVQETFDTAPAIRAACERSIRGHAEVLRADIDEARREHAPDADWSARGLALHTQAVIQGAFILAKAGQDAARAAHSPDHLRRYIELLFNPGIRQRNVA